MQHHKNPGAPVKKIHPYFLADRKILPIFSTDFRMNFSGFPEIFYI
jgi:hypothetical protein